MGKIGFVNLQNTRTKFSKSISQAERTRDRQDVANRQTDASPLLYFKSMTAVSGNHY
jgi:hypothetical protein